MAAAWWRGIASLGLGVVLVGAAGWAAAEPSREASHSPRRLAASTVARTPHAGTGASTVGVASWYGPHHHGRRTASGETFDMYRLTAAHRTFPLGTRVRVTNLGNGRNVLVRLSDRGPYVAGRLIDLSYAAGRALGMIERGTARVKIEVLPSPP